MRSNIICNNCNIAFFIMNKSLNSKFDNSYHYKGFKNAHGKQYLD